jgi:alpha 1,2-mannosyltransferase
MRSQTRVFVIITVFILIVLSFLHLNGNGIPNYLPQAAHDYFEPESQQPGQKSDPPSNDSNSGDMEESNMFETERTKLDALLEEFVQRPLMPYDEAVELNSKTCPTDGVNFDANAVRDNTEKWAAIPASQISDWRHSIASYLRRKQELVKEAKKAGSFVAETGRGIVMAAGDSAAVVRARTNLRLLKSYNCTLPVEIFHFSTELSASDKSLLEDLSKLEEGQEEQDTMKVTVRIVEGVEKGNGWKQFQIKGAAIQQSSFDDILYLDTDSYLLRNPNYLFESKQWTDTGLLLWPDYTKSHPTNPIWRLLGQQCRNEYEGESGQIFISRSRHQDLLWLVEYFAQHNEEYYGFMGGDRDSFRAAALLLGKPWAGPGRLNAAAGVVVKDNPLTGGHTMLQADPEGRWMFVHANLIKHAHFQRPLWAQIHRVAKDSFEVGTTYGDVSPPNNKIGEGVKLVVSSTPRMITTMSAFEGYDESVVAVDEWDMYEELKGFEEKWFAFGGQH